MKVSVFGLRLGFHVFLRESSTFLTISSIKIQYDDSHTCTCKILVKILKIFNNFSCGNFISK